MSVIDDALSAILKGANPDASDEDIQSQVAGLKQSGGEAVNQALSFIPGLNGMKDAASNIPAMANATKDNPIVQDIAKGVTGEPISSSVPNPGNPVSGAVQGLITGAYADPKPSAPSATPMPSEPTAPAPQPTIEPTEAPAPKSSPKEPAKDDTAALLAPSNDNDARNKMLQEAEKRRKLAIIPEAIGGVADAIGTGARAFGVNAPVDAQDKLLAQAKENFEQSKTLFEDKTKNDPNSDISKSYRQMVLQIAPDLAKQPTFQNMSAQAIGDKLPLIDTMMKARAAEDSKKVGLAQAQANKDLNIGLREDQQQDRLEQQARQSVTNLRGDRSLARAEEQRDAAIVAYNRLSEIQKSGKGLNPVDYVDILGQIYKARTGNAPGEQVLKDIRQSTAQGQFDKAYTYVTGQQAPATSKDITHSLISMAKSMGEQADKFHEGYMNSHLIKPSSLKDERWKPILQTGRGVSLRTPLKITRQLRTNQLKIR